MSLTLVSAEEQIVWKPLPAGDFIRCLILRPGLGDAPLEGKLRIFKLDQGPHYDAISYVWGSEAKTRTLVCDEKLAHITESLWMVLHRVRHTEKCRVLWADSICINEGDIIEKSHQIALMGQVYSRASKVLIHLAGNDEGHASQLASLVSETNDYVQQKLKLMDDLGSSSFPYLDAQDRTKVSQDARWESMRLALSQQWFSRGWVVQEAALARTAMVLWGSQEIPFDWILRTATWSYCRCFAETIGTKSAFQSFVRRGVQLHFFLYMRRFPHEAKVYGIEQRANESELIDILQIANGIGMTNPKDRIFAFLALEGYCQPIQEEPHGFSSYLVEQDYTKSTAEIFTEFARQSILRDGIRILQYGHPYDPDYNSEDLAMPSWVPRWGRPVKYLLPNTWEQKPLGPSPMFKGKVVRQITGSTLAVTGVIFDKLQFVSQVMSLEGDLEELTSLWQKIKDLHLNETYSMEARPNLMLECLSAGHASRDTDSAAWNAARGAVARFLLSGGQRPPEYLVEKVLDTATLWSSDRRLVSSTRGLLGVGPASVAVGDVCCIIFGCVWPFILRPVPGQSIGDEPRFHLLGLAWIAGITPQYEQGRGLFWPVLGDERSKDWVEWGFREQEIRII